MSCPLRCDFERGYVVVPSVLPRRRQLSSVRLRAPASTDTSGRRRQRRLSVADDRPRSSKRHLICTGRAGRVMGLIPPRLKHTAISQVKVTLP